ncbi:MAG: anaerobic glycerol-3-phosphate dehydrogenase subunit C [Propionibacterium sp.]|nr:MAG: anaerobic glycerol-3-phosphate dehydrogenase subunit C [Propionibacterium sp.]
MRPIRIAVEKIVGVHRDAPMPEAHLQTFMGWWRRHKAPESPRTRGPVVFFHGCAGGYFEVETSIKTVEVLEHLGYEVVVPKQGCCGLAEQSNGLYEGATKQVLRLCDQLRSAGKELTIVTASGSCAGMLKHEAHEIMGVDDPKLIDVGTRMREISEFLMELHDAGELPTDFRRNDITIPYHAPCQLKGQGMGMPAVPLMELIPGVTVIESGAACCGVAGTYGMKKEKYEVAQAVGQPVFELFKEHNEGIAACETETCRWQLRTATGVNVVHPIWLVHKAYGLADD